MEHKKQWYRTRPSLFSMDEDFMHLGWWCELNKRFERFLPACIYIYASVMLLH